jgi:peptidoglycan/xylan/chitin deacetylase (PgdA/CDA1 family)
MCNWFSLNKWRWYRAKTPDWLQRIYPQLIWKIPSHDRVVYLSFDDGPIPEVTGFVLDLLKEYEYKANFFCIGENVAAHPDIYDRIISEQHRSGNHTQNHLNGWKTTPEVYFQNITAASRLIKSDLFRPPYGRITRKQRRKLHAAGFRIIMWDVLSGDFDVNNNPENCYRNVINNIQPGSIVVFHDSVKAFPVLQKTLPRILNWLKDQQYACELIE